MQVFLCFYNLFADLWHISVNFYTWPEKRNSGLMSRAHDKKEGREIRQTWRIQKKDKKRRAEALPFSY